MGLHVYGLVQRAGARACIRISFEFVKNYFNNINFRSCARHGSGHRIMKNYKEIKVHSHYFRSVADALEKAIVERKELVEDERFASEYPNLTKALNDEIKEFNNIIKQLKS